MRISVIDRDNITDEIVDRVLYKDLADSGENADCIIVLGSIKASKYRIPVAVEAYRKGRSPKILLSGGAIRDFSEEKMTEAEHMRMHAIDMGVSPDDILIDNVSQNTVENMLGSLLVMQRSFMLNNVGRVLLVTTSYHMRRSLALARYLFPKHIEIVPCPADDTNTRRENWMKSEEGRKRAVNEVINIINCVENRLFPDFEI
ncbi:YdcF family protein [Butyrivibrio fibrisolvens]|uniref:YdcF family protein n=1 Tax=Butyrivibrio fibrisolvens TaxID=831 RepID=UPI0003B46FFB|nr:YdcF family protein [Butyrivibrio fibrisolvens]